jgi:hypothetical protein
MKPVTLLSGGMPIANNSPVTHVRERGYGAMYLKPLSLMLIIQGNKFSSQKYRRPDATLQPESGRLAELVPNSVIDLGLVQIKSVR